MLNTVNSARVSILKGEGPSFYFLSCQNIFHRSDPFNGQKRRERTNWKYRTCIKNVNSLIILPLFKIFILISYIRPDWCWWFFTSIIVQKDFVGEGGGGFDAKVERFESPEDMKNYSLKNSPPLPYSGPYSLWEHCFFCPN